MLIIAGRLDVHPENRDRYVADCTEVIQNARVAPGCLDFTLSADPLVPGRINVYERWESDEELLAFRGSGPGGAQAEQILDASVHKYRISATEAP